MTPGGIIPLWGARSSRNWGAASFRYEGRNHPGIGGRFPPESAMRRMARTSAACSRLMTIPGVGQLTALAFVAAIDDPSRIRRSRDIGAYLGLVPRRYQSGEVDYVGSISKCGDRRVRTLLYEAANVMLTRYKGPLDRER